MKLADISLAVPLIARRADLQRRIVLVSSSATLGDVYQTLVGTGLEDAIIANARQQVTDFLQKAISDVEGQMVALGVELGA